MLLPHFDDHPPSPVEAKNCEAVRQNIETHSYHLFLDRLKKAFEHCRILFVPSLSVSLPFRQAFETISKSTYYDVVSALTC